MNKVWNAGYSPFYMKILDDDFVFFFFHLDSCYNLKLKQFSSYHINIKPICPMTRLNIHHTFCTNDIFIYIFCYNSGILQTWSHVNLSSDKNIIKNLIWSNILCLFHIPRPSFFDFAFKWATEKNYNHFCSFPFYISGLESLN